MALLRLGLGALLSVVILHQVPYAVGDPYEDVDMWETGEAEEVIDTTEGLFGNLSEMFEEAQSPLAPESVELDEREEDSQRRLQSNRIIDQASRYDPDISVFAEPPDGAFSSTAMGVFVRAHKDKLYWADIYYETSTSGTTYPTLTSPKISYTSPYIHIQTEFGQCRTQYLIIVAVIVTPTGTIRTNELTFKYLVEGGDRKDSYGFFVPGVETGGKFVKVALEMEGVARAQSAGTQEFADFYTDLGIGLYLGQTDEIDLPSIDADLNGFEGGFPVNVTGDRHYGILVPFHNGIKFHGKVVRIDLQLMAAATMTDCLSKVRSERWDSETGTVIATGQQLVNGSFNPAAPPDVACITILDLTTLHPNARGFRRGFVGYPYAYLAPGQFDVAIRFDMENFGLNSTKFVEMGRASQTYVGFSGGFADGLWSCFVPMRATYGIQGGIRSKLPVDQNQLRPYHTSVMACIGEDGWNNPTAEDLFENIVTIDFAKLDPDLRGFSGAVRVGRFAYLAPLATDVHLYHGKIVRLDLGDHFDVGTSLRNIYSSGQNVVSVVRVMDLSQRNPNLKGFSDIFVSGKYVYLVPFRNAYEPATGQRGHGYLVRIDMNSFNMEGVIFIDVSSAQRAQIPSLADTDLRGFIGGFPSGRYGVLVPFYNAVFSGKVARLRIFPPGDDLTSDVQELDMTISHKLFERDVYKGFRGGFVSLWKASSVGQDCGEF
jgi:hypothetical protein